MGRSLKVPELCTPAFEKKIVQWLYKLNRTSTHSDIFPLCRMAEWPEPISCHDNPAWCLTELSLWKKRSFFLDDSENHLVAREGLEQRFGPTRAASGGNGLYGHHDCRR